MGAMPDQNGVSFYGAERQPLQFAPTQPITVTNMGIYCEDVLYCRSKLSHILHLIPGDTLKMANVSITSDHLTNDALRVLFK